VNELAARSMARFFLRGMHARRGGRVWGRGRRTDRLQHTIAPPRRAVFRGLSCKEAPVEDGVDGVIGFGFIDLKERLRREYTQRARPIAVERQLQRGLARRRRCDVAGLGDRELARRVDVLGRAFVFAGFRSLTTTPAALQREAARHFLPHPGISAVTIATLS
jgi:hypothetical protein